MKAGWCGQEVYDVARQFAQSCLLEDGSLFNPGREIWTAEPAELLEGLIADPGEGSGFIGKFESQVEGRQAGVIQLAAEVLFVQLLAEDDVKAETKRGHVERILALAPERALLPESLRSALGAGGVASYGAGKAYRDAYMRFLLRFVASFKGMVAGERAHTLGDPWAFLAVVEGSRTSTDAMTANALLHLLFPDTFEYAIAQKDRNALIGAFAAAPGVDEAEGDNRKLARIREVATEALGRDVELYEDPFKRVWREEASPAWTELVGWARRLEDREDFDREERDYKLTLAALLGRVRQAIERGEGWDRHLRSALTAKENNLLDWRVSGKLLDWALERPDEFREMLVRLWAGEEAAAAIQEFLAALPHDAISGQGTRISVASFLLLGADPPAAPFFKPGVYGDLRKALQLPPAPQVEVDSEGTYRPEQLAASLGVDGKRVRAFLREAFERDPTEKGADWILTGAQAEAVVTRFGEGSDPTTLVAPYIDWVSLLEELRLRLLGDGVVLRDLLDAQGLAYWIVQGAPPDDWSEADVAALLEFREGVDQAGDGSGNDRGKRERTRREGKCQICEKEVPLEEQFTLENDLDRDIVVRTVNAARPGAEGMSHYCADCVEERERGKLEWLRDRRRRRGGEVDGAEGQELEGLVPATPALAASLHLPEAWLQKNVIDLLFARRQLIFYGPPGTGKTYVAQALADHLTEMGGEVRLVQFHPSYTYEDFFEGYRPRAKGEDGAIGFELVPGVLRELAETARRDPGNPYVLIVDEINRGNIAKIFGELYFLLEYRDKAIRLQYSGSEEFSIPPNLLLIGTMNTADRSIALIDGALRRRFKFVEFNPAKEPVDEVLTLWLGRHDLDPEPAALLDALNRAIDDGDFSVGPSYFMTADGTDPDLDSIWRHEILPLLEERYYGSRRDIEREFGLAALKKKTAEDADRADGEERSDGLLSP